MKTSMKKSLSIALGTIFLAAMSASPVANADANPFGMQNLESGYMQVAEEGKGMENKSDKAKEAKCGEGKCGEGKKAKKEGKCGEGKCGEGKKAKKEGKCGEGKCGEGKK